MLARTHRFHGYNSLNFAYKQGQTVRGQLVSVKVALNPRRKTYRAAVVVSRKVSKSAVTRNRIRRRIFAALDPVTKQITQPYDLVWSVYSDQLVDMPLTTLRQLVQRQLQQAKVIPTAQREPRAIVKTKAEN